MASFDEVFPGQGLLIVIDEFPNTYTTQGPRTGSGLPAYLRQIGEVTAQTRFLIHCWWEEAILTAAVPARCRQHARQRALHADPGSTARTSASSSPRLLKKTADQQNKIREYLTPLPSSMDP